MRKTFKAIILATALASGPVAAQTNAPPAGSATAMLQLVADGQYEAARTMLTSAPHNPVDRLFLEAKIFQAKGEIPQAITTYRAILSLAPGLIPVRQALAGLLFAQEDYAGARFHFERLIELDQRPELRKAYQQALRQVRLAEPYGVSAYLSFTPSTNINRGSSNSEFTTSGQGTGVIVDSGQEKSGIGLRVGGQAFAKFPVGDNAGWTVTAQGNWTLYSDDRFDYGQAGLNAAYKVSEQLTQTEFSGFVFRNLRELSPGNSDVYGLGVDHRRRSSDDTVLSFSTNLVQTEYDDSDALSGPNASFRVGAQRQLRPDLSLLGNVTLSRGLPEGENNRYLGAAAEIGLSKNWQSGWSNFAAIQIGGRRYDEEFTAGAPEREDDFVILKGSLLNSNIVFRGYTPRIDCLLQQNWSNISFYDYQVAECGVVFTREF